MTEPYGHHVFRLTRIGVMAIAVLATSGCAVTVGPQGLRPGSDIVGYPERERGLWETLLDPCTWGDSTSTIRRATACAGYRDQTPARGGLIPPVQKIP